MRFRKLQAVCFGPLREREFTLDAQVVIVVGPNEAGKTSFRAAIETILYGFDPARREKHPLFDAQQNTDLELMAELQIADQECAIERLLQDRGKLRRATIGEAFAGRRSPNNELPCVQEIPLELYRAVYALSSSDLVELEADVRAHVDDLLLGERALPELRAAHSVRSELQRDHLAIWRPDNRGNSVSRKLSVARDEAIQAKRKAREEEDTLRAALEERDRIEVQLVQQRERRSFLQEEESEAGFLGRLAGFKQRKQGLKELNFDALDGMKLLDPAELQADLEAVQEELAIPRAQLERPAPELSAQAALLLAREDEIASVCAQADRDRSERSALREREGKQAGRLEALQAELQRLHAADSTDSLVKATSESLASYPIAGLRGAHRSWSEHWEDPIPWVPREDGNRRLLVTCAALIGIAASLAAAFDTIDPRLAAALAVLALIGLLGLALQKQEAPPEPRREREAEVDRLLELAGIPVQRVLTPSALLPWIDSLDRLVSRSTSNLAEAARITDSWAAIEEREDCLRRLLADLGLQAEGETQHLYRMLSKKLEQADERKHAVQLEQRERDRLRERVEDLEQQERKQGQKRACVLETLRVNVPTEPDQSRAFELLEEMRAEHAHVSRLEQQLRADPSWRLLHDDPRLMPAVGELPVWHEERARTRKDELAAIEAGIEAGSLRLGELRALLQADPGSRVARADEETLELGRQLAEVERQRDRLALLENLWVRAEREHRAEHQPDVLRRAGALLKVVTQGRYTHLEVRDGSLELEVSAADRSEPSLVAPPLSRGTRDQIFLCLRLALLDHLDAGREALPLILDDAVVQWDAARRAQLYPLLAEVSHKRQIFLLTCHEHLALEAQAALDSILIRLDSSSPAALPH